MQAEAELSLRGARVMVTRPEGQETGLCGLIENAGGLALHFPTLRPVTFEPARIRERLAAVLPSDVVVFVSRSAVDFAFDACPDLPARLPAGGVYAAGEGTVAELANRGVEARSGSTLGVGSEGLLALPEFAPARIRGGRVVIVRGEGGRDLLRRVLEQRGAQPCHVEVYTRSTPHVDAALVKKIWQEDRPGVIVITSIQGLENLLLMTPETYRSRLLATPLATISSRVGERAHALGFHAAVAVAGAADDRALLRAAADALGAA